MKNMYIHLFTTCCLIATITHAAENQGQTFGRVIRSSVPKVRKSYCAAACPAKAATIIGTEKPIIYPFTNHDIFDAHENPKFEPKNVYQKNTKSHKAQLRILIPAEDAFPSILDDSFPSPHLQTTAPITETITTAVTNQAAPFSFPNTTKPLLMLTDLVVTSVAAAPSADDGYASDASSVFDEKKHLPIATLSKYRITGGYGYTVPAAVALAIGKKEVPGSKLRAKMAHKKTDLHAALAVLSCATSDEVDTILTYAAQQKSRVVDTANLTMARDTAQRLELAMLATMDPEIVAARAQAARVKCAQDALAKEEKALHEAQQKISLHVPKALHRKTITDSVFGMMGSELQETPLASADLPSHENIAAEIEARKTALKKPALISSATSSATRQPAGQASSTSELK